MERPPAWPLNVYSCPLAEGGYEGSQVYRPDSSVALLVGNRYSPICVPIGTAAAVYRFTRRSRISVGLRACPCQIPRCVNLATHVDQTTIADGRWLADMPLRQ